MADPQPDVMDATYRLFALSFELVDAEFERLPGQLATTLTSPAVQDAIKKTLLDFARSQQKKSESTVLSPEEAKKFTDALTRGVQDAATTELLSQIKGTPQYKRLVASLETFKKAAESSTLGVWVDRNKNILYVVGAALLVGGGTVLYVTKTGGSVLNAALSPVLDRSFDVIHIGALKLSVDKLEFRPDARVLGGRVASTMHWDRLDVTLKLGVIAQGAQFQQATGEAVVKSGPVSVSANAGANASKPVNLGLRVEFQTGKFKLGLGAIYQDNLPGGSASASYRAGKYGDLGLNAGIGERKEGGTKSELMATWSIPF